MTEKAYKIMLLGCMSVGKTSIARRLKFDTFDVNHKTTIGVQLYSIELKRQDGNIQIVLWDTDGELGENVLQEVFVKGSDAAIVVGDANRESTILSMLGLSERFRSAIPGAPVLSLINKADLKIYSEAELEEHRRRCAEIRQCSAKDNDGVIDSIEHVVRLIRDTESSYGGAPPVTRQL